MSAVSSEAPQSADLSEAAPATPATGAGEGAPHEHSGDGAASKDFGPNEWLVDELYQRYLADPGSVDMAWWNFFADYSPPAGSAAARAAAQQGLPAAPAPAPRRGRRPRLARHPRPAAQAPAAPPQAGPAGQASAPAKAAAPAAAPPRPAAPPAPAHVPRRRPRPRQGAPRGPAARRGRPDRGQHGRQPERPHRDQRPDGARQAADRQPHRHQQPPGPRPGRQGVVHPPDRVRGGQGAGRGPGDEPLLHRAGRQARDRRARARQPGPGHRRDRQGRVAPAAGARGQGRGGDGLPPVLDGVRGRGPPGPGRQAHRGRLRGHHDQPDQPGHDRHRALGAAADGRAGLHRGRRRHGVPGGLPGRGRGDHDPAGHQQVGHPHLDLRPPDHPGRAVRGVPAPDPPAAARRERLLGRGLPGAEDPLRADPLGARHPGRPRGRHHQVGPGARADPRLPGPRPPDGRHRPAGVQAAQAPRPGHQPARPDPVGPGAGPSPPAGSAASR